MGGFLISFAQILYVWLMCYPLNTTQTLFLGFYQNKQQASVLRSVAASQTPLTIILTNKTVKLSSYLLLLLYPLKVYAKSFTYTHWLVGCYNNSQCPPCPSTLKLWRQRHSILLLGRNFIKVKSHDSSIIIFFIMLLYYVTLLNSAIKEFKMSWIFLLFKELFSEFSVSAWIIKSHLKT